MVLGTPTVVLQSEVYLEYAAEFQEHCKAVWDQDAIIMEFGGTEIYNCRLRGSWAVSDLVIH